MGRSGHPSCRCIAMQCPESEDDQVVSSSGILVWNGSIKTCRDCARAVWNCCPPGPLCSPDTSQVQDLRDCALTSFDFLTISQMEWTMTRSEQVDCAMQQRLHACCAEQSSVHGVLPVDLTSTQNAVSKHCRPASTADCTENTKLHSLDTQ